jgi:hypothetical protein
MQLKSLEKPTIIKGKKKNENLKAADETKAKA